MDAFVYRDGDVVPRDVTRVVVHSSVRVLPPKVFKDCEKLEEVKLNEGLEEIGDEAFWGCVSLRRLNCPSTVNRIGAAAFWGCKKLEEVQLNEGLKEIGSGAFWDCVSLRRLSCPSTVLRIGVGAFSSCEKLEEIQLNEGLKEIRDLAFSDCQILRRLNCPSTVVRIGDRAFGDCRRLSVVELAGILKVEMDAFAGCHSLNRIQIRIQVPSRAVVVQQGNYRLVTDGTIAPTRGKFVLIAPRCLTALPVSNLTELRNSIGAIMNNGEGTEEERIDQVRQEVRREVGGEVSAILGLAFWKAKIDEAERARIGAVNDHREGTGGGRKRAKVDVALTQEARDGCRGEGKKENVIAKNVLPFLDSLWGKRSRGGP